MFHYDRPARPRPFIVDKVLLAAFYQDRIRNARTWDDLRALTHQDVYEYLRARDPEKLGELNKQLKGLLGVSLHELNQKLQRSRQLPFRLHSNGNLSVRVPPGLTLDSQFAELSSAEGVAETSVPYTRDHARLKGTAVGGSTIHLTEGKVLRVGAAVEVLARLEDVRDEPWAPRAFPTDLLRKMSGAVSLGGNALEDSEAEPT